MTTIRSLLAVLGAAALLAAGTAGAPASAQSGSGAPTPGAMPAWMSYERPADSAVVVAKGISVPVRDGSHLSCDLYRPGVSDSEPAPGRHPAVMYQFHGYGNNRTLQDPPQLSFLAARGYVGLQCNTRGTGGTPGEFALLGEQEARDGYDAVEWLGTQDFTNGDVAMMGYSYGAISAYRVAGLRPPHLRAILSHSSYEDLYRDIAHLGGIRGADIRGFLLGLMQAQNTVGTPPEQRVALQQRVAEIDAEMGEHLLDDEYWEQYEIDFAALEQSRLPILTMGGWYDIYQRGVPRLYQRLESQSYLVMDNVAHIETGPTFFGKTSGPALAWLDHWLQPARNAPLPTARVTAYQMPAGSGWTELADWPPPGTQGQTLHLDAGSSLSEEPGEAGSQTYRVDPADGMPTYWNTGTRPDSAPIIAWHTAREAQRTHFTTPALTDDLVVSGTPRAVIEASFTADDGYLVARLSDVAPDGTSTLVSTGWLQSSLARDASRSAPVPAGQRTTYDVEIWPVNWRFAAGHRLQLSLSSGDVPRIQPDAPPGDVTVFTGQGASTLQLPVAGTGTPPGTQPGTQPGTAPGTAAPQPGTAGTATARPAGSSSTLASTGHAAGPAALLLLAGGLLLLRRRQSSERLDA